MDGRPKRAAQIHQDGDAQQWAEQRRGEEKTADLPDSEIIASCQCDEQTDVSEESIFLRQDEKRQGDPVPEEPTPIIRTLQILPKYPETDECEAAKNTIDECVLRHVNLSRGKGH